jgi:hypothetical protein
MTPRSFWTIVIKILGFCIGYGFLTTVWRTTYIIIEYASIAKFYRDIKLNTDISDADIAMWSSLGLIILYILLFYCFLFKTDWVVKKLKLDKGYGEEIFELTVTQFTVIKTSVIIIGGWLILLLIPDLIHEIFSYFWEPINTRKFVHNRNVIYVTTDTLKIIIGIFMIVRADYISNFINRKSKNIIESLS